MIKKLLLALIAVVGLSATAVARNTYAHDDSVLPAAAKAVLAKNFKSKVSLVKIDKDFGRVSDYDVIMSDGTEITFDPDGNWTEVEVGISSSVPKGFIPDGVADYVRSNHKGQYIVGIEKGRRGYDVELNDGIDMKFDLKGNFVRYDD